MSDLQNRQIPRLGDGVDIGLKTGEKFKFFVFWVVTRHQKTAFDDDFVMRLIRDEFPYRTNERKWPNRKRRTFQSIPDQRDYARATYGRDHKLGIKSQEHAKEVLKRIDAKMKWQNPTLPSSTDGIANATERSAVSRNSDRGAGFGNSENNAIVERMAVEFVTAEYVRNRWRVKSVESEKCGFDLHCSKGKNVEKVEVKGVSGKSECFVVTAGEIRVASSTSDFILCVVTDLAGSKPRLHRYSGSQFLEQFHLRPLQFQASKHTGKSPSTRP